MNWGNEFRKENWMDVSVKNFLFDESDSIVLETTLFLKHDAQKNLNFGSGIGTSEAESEKA